MIDNANGWFTISSGTAIFGVVILAGAALIILFSKRREEAQIADRTNIKALNDLIDTKDKQLGLKDKEIETLSGEYKQIAQVIVKEIIEAWMEHSQQGCYIENARLRAELAEYKARLAVFEEV